MSQDVTAAPAAPAAESAPMSHKEILEALSGLLIAMFVAILSSTVVTTALPTIVTDLHGTQTGYTWVLVATMLAMTATTPIWGKLADLFSKKLLMQVALIVYVSGSALAGLAQSMSWLIGARVITGLGVGGVMALIQIIIGSMVSPRERGRYSGYIGASFGLATLLGPLVGGLIVDSALGWRGCFYVGLPFAIVAFFVLQLKLHLPTVKREVKIDYLGATLLMGGVSLLLIWVSLAGQQFDWVSGTSALMLVGGLVVLAVALLVEAKHAVEPIIPLQLFKDRTISLATFAAVMVGVAMLSATTFMAEYFQTARGMSPTHAGLMSLSMVVGLMGTSIVSGRMISSTGRWKAWLVGGMVAVVIGTGLLGTIDHATPLWVIGAYMLILGAGLGSTQQNLILAVQNNVDQANIGAASSVVAFFRTLGGAIGVSVFGAILSHQVIGQVTDGIRPLVASGDVTPAQATALGDGGLQSAAVLPAPLRMLIEAANGDATGHIFLFAVPFALMALIAVLFVKEGRLRTTLDRIEEPEVNMDLAAELEVGELGRR
ncbi:drug resistance transporter, EmrB/QacA subfamily [Nocardioides terrae]|uniref:Drug resistance transporter, EmrB/QacA subfamily n=1 Tax=Nocardioides terrae TaxID=574651 RepID=A0A1I1KKM7_9ACTN|nr:MDR family MFS transporter [Nocardioides terrae]SFC61115.1 drug resistance transporter, EmrB/QacA subfamily [Nocardioides terrae]